MEVFILNYGHLDNAADLAINFEGCRVKVTILCAECPADDYGKHRSAPIIRRPSTDFYADLWNEVDRVHFSEPLGVLVRGLG